MQCLSPLWGAWAHISHEIIQLNVFMIEEQADLPDLLILQYGGATPMHFMTVLLYFRPSSFILF